MWSRASSAKCIVRSRSSGSSMGLICLSALSQYSATVRATAWCLNGCLFDHRRIVGRRRVRCTLIQICIEKVKRVVASSGIV